MRGIVVAGRVDRPLRFWRRVKVRTDSYNRKCGWRALVEFDDGRVHLATGGVRRCWMDVARRIPAEDD